MKVKKILISQPQPADGKSPFNILAEKYNVKLVFRPFIKVDPITAREFREQKVNILEHTAIVFTSKIGIEHFFRMIKDLNIERNLNPDLKYFCISESIANFLQKHLVNNYRKRKVFFGTTGKLDDLFSVINKHPKEKYLFVLPENNNDGIIEMLQNSKLDYHIGVMYRTVSNDFTSDEPFNYDMLIFFSPQGIAALLKNFPNFDQGEIIIGCLGSSTAQAIKDANLRLDIEVPSPKYTSISVAMDEFLKENHKRK